MTHGSKTLPWEFSWKQNHSFHFHFAQPLLQFLHRPYLTGAGFLSLHKRRPENSLNHSQQQTPGGKLSSCLLRPPWMPVETPWGTMGTDEAKAGFMDSGRCLQQGITSEPGSDLNVSFTEAKSIKCVKGEFSPFTSNKQSQCGRRQPYYYLQGCSPQIVL